MSCPMDFGGMESNNNYALRGGDVAFPGYLFSTSRFLYTSWEIEWIRKFASTLRIGASILLPSANYAYCTFPISAKFINLPHIFVLFRVLAPPTLTVMHLRIMLTMYWTPFVCV